MAFETITKLGNGFKKINLDGITERALVDIQADISELNRDQLREGITSTGSFLPDYSNMSVQVFGKPSGPIKLYEFGDFYEGIVPEFAQKDFTLSGTDEKTDMLTKRYKQYGEVVGLTNDSISELAVKALPGIQDELRQVIRL